MKRVLKFLFIGPGALITVIVIGLSVCWLIVSGQQRQAEEAKKHQIQRELGSINPSSEVDPSAAQREKLLADRKLNPGTKSSSTPPALMPVSLPQVRALPTLVSFYAEVQPTPTPTPTPTPQQPEVKREPKYWLPPGTFIPCALVNTVESSHINTPVVAEITRNMYQGGKLIIPAGSIANSFAQSGAVRDRIEVAGTWVIVYPDGRQLRVKGIACDREADPSNQQFGLEDGSAGLQGELIESDHWANAKAFIALLMTASMQTGTAVATATLQANHTTGVTSLPDTTPILAKYLDQLLNGETGDGRFVRVRSSKEFYICTTEVIYPQDRTVEDWEVEQKETKTNPVLDAIQQQSQPHENTNLFSY